MGAAKAAQKASPTVLKTYPPLPSMALCRISSWRTRAFCMADASRSHILVEPSMSVNRKVTVPVGGGTAIRCTSSFPADTIKYRSYKRLPFTPAKRPSELENVEVSGYVYGAAEGHLCLGCQFQGIGEPACAEVGEDETLRCGRTGYGPSLFGGGVSEGVGLLLGVPFQRVRFVYEEIGSLGALYHRRIWAGVGCVYERGTVLRDAEADALDPMIHRKRNDLGISQHDRRDAADAQQAGLEYVSDRYDAAVW
jgi:hypothetical protein